MPQDWDTDYDVVKAGPQSMTGPDDIDILEATIGELKRRVQFLEGEGAEKNEAIDNLREDLERAKKDVDRCLDVNLEIGKLNQKFAGALAAVRKALTDSAPEGAKAFAVAVLALADPDAGSNYSSPDDVKRLNAEAQTIVNVAISEAKQWESAQKDSLARIEKLFSEKEILVKAMNGYVQNFKSKTVQRCKHCKTPLKVAKDSSKKLQEAIEQADLID